MACARSAEAGSFEVSAGAAIDLRDALTKLDLPYVVGIMGSANFRPADYTLLPPKPMAVRDVDPPGYGNRPAKPRSRPATLPSPCRRPPGGRRPGARACAAGLPPAGSARRTATPIAASSARSRGC
jgi:hypothetical protein